MPPNRFPGLPPSVDIRQQHLAGGRRVGAPTLGRGRAPPRRGYCEAVWRRSTGHRTELAGQRGAVPRPATSPCSPARARLAPFGFIAVSTLQHAERLGRFASARTAATSRPDASGRRTHPLPRAAPAAPTRPRETTRDFAGVARCAVEGLFAENVGMGILHVFDMDGALLAGTTASVELARQLGGVEDLQALEARFAAEEIDTHGFAVTLREMWRGVSHGRVHVQPLAEWYRAGVCRYSTSRRAVRGDHDVPGFLRGPPCRSGV
jgi:hypothetical protein